MDNAPCQMGTRTTDHGSALNWITYTWFVGVPLCYMWLMGTFRSMGLWPEPSRRGTRRSDVLSFQIVAGLCCAYIAASGCHVLLNHPDYVVMAHDKVFGRSAFLENHVLIPMMVYQTWNLVACLALPDLRDRTMAGHHVLAGLLVYFTLMPYMQYYAVFFCGVTELTSIPQTIYSMFMYFPEHKTPFAWLFAGTKIVFAISFITIRIFAWSVISVDFWLASIPLLVDDKETPVVPVIFLAANVFLTGLQFMWGTTIARRLLSAIGLTKRQKVDAK